MVARKGSEVRTALLVVALAAAGAGAVFVGGVLSSVSAPLITLHAVWSKRFGTNGGTTHARAVVADAAGDVVMAGAFFGSADFGKGTVESGADEDVFVAKYSPDGRYLWSHTSRGNRIAHAGALTTDSAGNVYVAGSFDGSFRFGTFELKSQGALDTFVAKYRRDGELVWCKSFGGLGSDRGVELIGADSRGVLLVGDFSEVIRFGDTELVSAGGHDGFVARLDDMGNAVWAKRFGGVGTELVNAAASGRKGAIVVAGEFDGTSDLGGEPLTASADRDVFVALYTSAGSHVWSKRFGTTGLNQARGVAAHPDGAIVVVGSFTSAIAFGSVTLQGTGTSDAFIAAISEIGAPLWSKHFGGASSRRLRAMPGVFPANSGLNDVVVMPSGDVASVGLLAGTGDIEGHSVSATSPFGDLVLVVYARDGKLRWLSHVSGGEPWPSGLARDAAGTLLISGAFDGELPFAGHPLAGGGAFLARLRR